MLCTGKFEAENFWVVWIKFRLGSTDCLLFTYQPGKQITSDPLQFQQHNCYCTSQKSYAHTLNTVRNKIHKIMLQNRIQGIIPGNWHIWEKKKKRKLQQAHLKNKKIKKNGRTERKLLFWSNNVVCALNVAQALKMLKNHNSKNKSPNKINIP